MEHYNIICSSYSNLARLLAASDWSIAKNKIPNVLQPPQQLAQSKVPNTPVGAM